MRAAAFGAIFLSSILACAGPAFAGVAAAEKADATEADWVPTDHTIATALATGKYDIRASYRAEYKDIPITVYVLQSATDRADVLECYSTDDYETPVKCVKPKGAR